jgi:hypothetical protein
MKKSILSWIFVFSFTGSSVGGTAGPSDDEIFLLIIPVILFILYLGIPAIIKFLKEKIAEWKEKTHLANHDNGIAG